MSMSYYATAGLDEFEYFYSRWLKSGELMGLLVEVCKAEINRG